MDLQSYLVNKFINWRPPPPTVEGRTKCDVTLRWSVEPFEFMDGELLYWVQKKEKMPSWVVVYSGGKTTKTIDNLAPRHPHKFRLKVILKATAVSTLAERALKYFGNKKAVHEHLGLKGTDTETKGNIVNEVNADSSAKKTVLLNKQNIDLDDQTVNEVGSGEGDTASVKEGPKFKGDTEAAGDVGNQENMQTNTKTESSCKKWLESQWSEETSTSTDTDGTSAVCFCMAVRCGYLKQVQVMLEERPALLEIINSSNGFTPLATAVRKGDINTVKFLITAGADVNQPSSTGQMPLHLAALGARPALVDLLLDNGADVQARDINGLRVEHYAVDAGSPEMVLHILQRGGDLHVRDNNGWTPLFRAVTQGASTELIELLVLSGSDVDAADYAGLALSSAARLLYNRQYGHEKTCLIERACEANEVLCFSLGRKTFVCQDVRCPMSSCPAVPLSRCPAVLYRSHCSTDSREILGRVRDSILRLVDSQYPHEQAVANFTRLTKKISSLHTILK